MLPPIRVDLSYLVKQQIKVHSFFPYWDYEASLIVTTWGNKFRQWTMLWSFCCLLQYATDVLQALRSIGSNAVAAAAVSSSDVLLPPPELELVTECGGASASISSVTTAAAEVEDWAEELGLDDVESDGDESDEDLLCNKLCTYVVTQKEFMNQHWYHCHT